MVPRFYPNGAPAPAAPPAYLVITPTGAWAYEDAREALACASQLRSNGVDARAVKRP